MTSKKFVGMVLVCLACLLGKVVAGQSGSAADAYTIGPQDLLGIVCANDASVSGKFLVQSDGTISLQLIGTVKVDGLTVSAIEELIKKRFRDAQFFAEPKISVTVEAYKSQKVIINGEVRTPGQYQITGVMNLLELIAQAGSMLPTASGEVTIIRTTGDGQQEFINRDLSNLTNGFTNVVVPLRNGDLVIVHQADRAYILGEVKNPNAYPVRPGTTLTQLLSLAGGPTADAALNRVKITRTVNGKTVEIKNAKGSEIIKPGDTITVPVRYL